MRLEVENMRARLQREHTPQLQALREGALDKRTETMAQEELKVRGQLESEMSVLRGKLEAETRKAVDLQRIRMIDEHRHRAEALTQDVLRRHESELRSRREAMTQTHQAEQETVLRELSEALSMGVREALEDHAELLRAETARKTEQLREESMAHTAEALRDLERKMRAESDAALRHIKEAAAAELDLQESRMKGELAAEHAAKVNKLQLDVSGRKRAAQRESAARYQADFARKVQEYDHALQSDMADNVEVVEARYADKLSAELVSRRNAAEERQARMLKEAEDNFHAELKSMSAFVDSFFAGSVANSEPSSPSAGERHMPTTKRAIQGRLASLTEQFEAYKSRYRRAARDVGKLQDEVVELRQKLRLAMRAVDASTQRGGEGASIGSRGEGRSGVGAAMDDLVAANESLIRRVGRR